MIQNISSRNAFPLPVRNTGIQKLVNQINANIASNGKYDRVDLSLMAQKLIDSKNDATKQRSIINYDDSPKVGKFTQAEWAEKSLHHQRNGLETIGKVIDYSIAKLDYTISNINELEDYLATGVHSDPYMTQAKAEDYLNSYQQSIVTDYTKLIEDYANVYRSFIDQYDYSSGGIASQVMDNQMNDISAKSLGLSDLSNDPTEIKKSLESASQQVNEMIVNLEAAFTEASGGKVWDPVEPMTKNTWTERLEVFRSETEIVSIGKYESLTGDYIEIDRTLLVGFQGITPTMYRE